VTEFYIEQVINNKNLASFSADEIRQAVRLFELCWSWIISEDGETDGSFSKFVYAPPIYTDELINPSFNARNFFEATRVFEAIKLHGELNASARFWLVHCDDAVMFPDSLLEANGLRDRVLLQLRKVAVSKEEEELELHKIDLIYTTDGTLCPKSEPKLFYRPKKRRAELLRILIEKSDQISMEKLAISLADDDNNLNGYDVKSNARDMNKEFSEHTGIKRKIIRSGNGGKCWFNFLEFNIDKQ
jgi:hypothetical protein